MPYETEVEWICYSGPKKFENSFSICCRHFLWINHFLIVKGGWSRGGSKIPKFGVFFSFIFFEKFLWPVFGGLFKLFNFWFLLKSIEVSRNEKHQKARPLNHSAVVTFPYCDKTGNIQKIMIVSDIFWNFFSAAKKRTLENFSRFFGVKNKF